MPGTLQEELYRLEREIQLYIEFDRAEKARFNRESLLWTAEQRIEWQETQADNASVLHDLRTQTEVLRQKLSRFCKRQ